ncbi:MAG: gluconate 2-dehydrogenase subunit 3 family protein [Candidatus Dormibacteraeota bacterium]|nr:gluconate 2-dehydrogenase subunit 3 family protein [Candidatus Dormibacteraeota bacterium]
MAYDRKQGGHQVAQANRPDYRLEVGRAEVPVGEPRGFAVLDPGRAATLRAWVSTLIPAGSGRPEAGAVGAAEYIDATVSKVPSLRPALLLALERIDVIARTKARRPFAECAADERESVLKQFQLEDDADAFQMVSDFTYEAYYGHPDVLAALEPLTGWRATAPLTGSTMAPFDQGRLARVKSLPPRYRLVPPDKGIGK